MNATVRSEEQSWVLVVHYAVLWYADENLFVEGVFQGSSDLIFGEGSADKSGGVIVSVNPGDVVVVPAGVAHASITATSDYRYIGVYPKVCHLLC